MRGNSKVIMSLKITQHQSMSFLYARPAPSEGWGWMSVSIVKANQFFSVNKELCISKNTTKRKKKLKDTIPD
jgi:hypothetical protein